MCRVATPAEVLAVAESGGREVSLEGLREAAGMVAAMRIVSREASELRDWRGEAPEGL